MLTHVVRHRLDVVGVDDVLDVELTARTFGQPRRQLLRGLVVEHRKRVEDAAGRLSGDHGPHAEGETLGRISRWDVSTGRGSDRCRVLQAGLRLVGLGLCRCCRLSRGRRRIRFDDSLFGRGCFETRFGLGLDGLGLDGLGLVGLGSLRVDQFGQCSGVQFALARCIGGQRLHLVAVLHGIGDELDHVLEVGVAHRLQLQLWDVELPLRTVLDAHGHQRIQTQLDQRDLTRQILGLVTHRLCDDLRQSIVDGLTGGRIPPGADLIADLRFGHKRVVDEPGLLGRHRRGGGRRLNGGRRRSTGDHHGVEQQPERIAFGSMHLQRPATRVRCQGGGQRGGAHRLTVREHRRHLYIGKHLRRGNSDEFGEVGCRRCGHLPDVATVGKGHVRSRHPGIARPGRDVRGQPVRLAFEPGPRDLGEIALPEQ